MSMPVLRPVLVRHDPASWAFGYQAGLAGRSSQEPPGVKDDLTWISGYIEGKAKRENRA
jgi:ribosome modulation factor